MKGKILPPGPRLFEPPALGGAERQVIAQIDDYRAKLRHRIADPRRWVGSLRRLSFARAIQGSNSIEGINVSLDDAVSLAGGEEPLDATSETAAAVRGYRDALTFVLQLASDPHFTYSEMLVRSLHFMMLQHDLTKSPGLWRPGIIYVRDDATGQVVYEGPDSDAVPGLVDEFVGQLNETSGESVLVRAAIAHLNLVMIHPFRDGNGRMARALQTLVLAREGVLSPHFCSIEEYLGRNTGAYYAVLAEVGQGRWQPQNDTMPWIRFSLTAHLRQARTLLRRFSDIERLWNRLEDEVRRAGLPERALLALSDAAMGLRVRNASYRIHEEATRATAGRDLKMMVDAGLLAAHGEKRGRSYVGSDRLRAIWKEIRESSYPIDLVDPFASHPLPPPLKPDARRKDGWSLPRTR
jgi:Fic family protein